MTDLEDCYEAHEEAVQETRRLKLLLDKAEMYMGHRSTCGWNSTAYRTPCDCGVTQLGREIWEALRDKRD